MFSNVSREGHPLEVGPSGRVGRVSHAVLRGAVHGVSVTPAAAAPCAGARACLDLKAKL